MEVAKLVLEYLKVILSPQVIAGGIALSFFLIFREDIKALMLRIAKIKFPGGGEVSTSQLERTSEESTAENTPPPAPPGGVPLPEGLSLTPDQVQVVRQVFEAERARAALWEYRYLNYFLVPTTQRVLDWLASLTTRTTVSLFDTFWLPMIPNAEERTAIINALQAHHLIVLTGELIEVTPKGREYINWRGTLPPLPAPST